MKESKQAFLKYWIPLIEVLKEMDGSGKGQDVTDRIIEKMSIPDEIVKEKLKSGGSRIRNQIAWARSYLGKAGFIDSSAKRGIWTLTEKGHNTNLSDEDVYPLFREIYSRWSSTPNIKDEVGSIPNEQAIEEEELPEFSDYKTELLNVLQSISPKGFERLCKRLLIESGFEQVHVTGKTGDGGIDGNGIYQVNPLISFAVSFQCKRYKSPVPVSHIRDFRGAIIGISDKGIFLTTSTFTAEAMKEARRVSPPIELVDGEKLVEMFENIPLGLKPRKDFDIDYEFFENYKD